MHIHTRMLLRIANTELHERHAAAERRRSARAAAGETLPARVLGFVPALLRALPVRGRRRANRPCEACA